MDKIAVKLVDSILSHKRNKFLKKYAGFIVDQDGIEYGSPDYYEKMIMAILQEYDIMLYQLNGCKHSPAMMVINLIESLNGVY